MKNSTKSRLTPVIVGADIELGNFIEDPSQPDGNGRTASRLILQNIPGVIGRYYGYQDSNPQDSHRRWLTNGSCVYIDLDHAEMCLPELTNAWDFCASFHAQLKIVREAQVAAQRTMRPGATLHVMVCNSDGSGSSWGSHLNFMIADKSFHEIFKQKMHYLLWLASYQASAIVIGGFGKVGSENQALAVDYQISQRADFMQEVVGLQTTFDRPILNTRSESLTGPNSGLSRLHHISSDVNLCHYPTVLKVGIMQILLCMIECGAPEISPAQILQQPVKAFRIYSHDPDLNAGQRILGGTEVTAVRLQRGFYRAAARFVRRERERCEQAVPRAQEILDLWDETLSLLEAKDWAALSTRLDWVLKRCFLNEVLAENAELNWQSPEIKHLDLMYGSLDPEQGIYWSMERAGLVSRLVTDRQIERFVTEPPSDTRAYTRANLIDTFGPQNVCGVDWDCLRIRVKPQGYAYGYAQTIALDNPAGQTRAETGGVFKLFRGGRISAQQVLHALAPESSGVLVPPSVEKPTKDRGSLEHYWYGGNRNNGY